jgi:hypothetical protein
VGCRPYLPAGRQEKWYFSIIDVIAALTGSPRPRKYWNALKTKLKEEGSELSQNMGQLKLPAEDGKMRMTDVADTEQIFRLIQSIPSPKAEPFKLWLAQVGRERLDEMQDPELTIDRALEQYLRLGYSENWINQRLKGTSKNLERMARMSIVRPDKTRRRADTGTKYPTEEQRSMAEGEACARRVGAERR